MDDLTGTLFEVLLNVYDVTSNPGDPKNTIVRINNVTRDLGLGGVFHGAIQLATSKVEFAYGYCESGSGVYAVHARQNPMYQYRETICLGRTPKSMAEVKEIIQNMKATWPGSNYDLLTCNCCHFCEQLAAQLEVQPVPGWLNRFALGAAATVSMTQETVKTMQDIKQELTRLSGESISFLKTSWQKAITVASQQQQLSTKSLRQQHLQQQQQRLETQHDTAAVQTHHSTAEQAQASQWQLPAEQQAAGADVSPQNSFYSTSSSFGSSSRASEPLAAAAAAAAPGLPAGLQNVKQKAAATAATARQSLLAGMQQVKAAGSKLAAGIVAQTAAATGATPGGPVAQFSRAEAAQGPGSLQKSGNQASQQLGHTPCAGSVAAASIPSHHQGLGAVVPAAQPKLAAEFCAHSSSQPARHGTVLSSSQCQADDLCALLLD